MIAVTAVTYEYLGDSAVYVRTAHELVPGETVESLVRRILEDRHHRPSQEADRIELQIAVPVKTEGPKHSDNPWDF